jgi:dTDP-glucose 4,6-dehydratase (EC 4.2.1.46)
MRVLVTGGCGFIGSNFVRYVLREHGDWEVVNLDKLTYAGNPANLRDLEGDERYRFVRGDIADRALVDGILGDGVDAVVNFAAETHVDRSILDPSPFIETNVKGTQVLLEAARVHDIERFVHVSTDEVYGSVMDGRFTEDSPLRPNSPYAASKAAADLLCRAYHVSYGVPVVVTRSSNNYGPYQFPEKLIPLMIRNALSGLDLPVYGEGRQVRDWLYVEDNCRAIGLVLMRGRPGEVYNIGGGCEMENIEVVRAICRTLAERLKKDHEYFMRLIKHIRDPRGAAHDFRYALDCSKMRGLGWRPQVTFDEGIRRTVDWYLANRDWAEGVITGEYLEHCRRVYWRREQGV